MIVVKLAQRALLLTSAYCIVIQVAQPQQLTCVNDLTNEGSCYSERQVICNNYTDSNRDRCLSQTVLSLSYYGDRSEYTIFYGNSLAYLSESSVEVVALKLCHREALELTLSDVACAKQCSYRKCESSACFSFSCDNLPNLITNGLTIVTFRTIENQSCSDLKTKFVVIDTRDVDECDDGTYNCSKNALCTDQQCGYSCICQSGYQMEDDNYTCAQYSSTSPTSIASTIVEISLLISATEYSSSSPSAIPSIIVPSVSASEPVSETGLSTKVSPVITRPSITDFAPTTTKVKLVTTEPSSAIESTLRVTRSPATSLLPTSTEALLSSTEHSMISPTLIRNPESTSLEGQSPSMSKLLVASTGSLIGMSSAIIPSTVIVTTTDSIGHERESPSISEASTESLTTTEFQNPSPIYSTSPNVLTETAVGNTITNTESIMETTVTIMATESLALSILPSMTSESNVTVESSIPLTPSTTEYSSTSPTSIASTIVGISLLKSMTEYPSPSSSIIPSIVVPFASVSGTVSETGLSIKASNSLVIAESSIITGSEFQSATVRSSTSMMSLTIMATTDSTSHEGQSPSISENSVVSTGSLIITEFQSPSPIYSTSPNVLSESTMETTVTIMATESLRLSRSILPSMTLESHVTVESSIPLTPSTTRYSSTSPTSIALTIVGMSQFMSTTEYSSPSSSAISSIITTSTSVSEPVSETGLSIEASLLIMESSTITGSPTVRPSITDLTPPTTTEPSNTTLTVTRSPATSLLPTSTEMLLSTTEDSIPMISLTIIITPDSTSLGGQSPSNSEILVASTGFLNGMSSAIIPSTVIANITIEPPPSASTESGFPSVIYSKFQSTVGHPGLTESTTLKVSPLSTGIPRPTASVFPLSSSKISTKSTIEPRSLSISQLSIVEITSEIQQGSTVPPIPTSVPSVMGELSTATNFPVTTSYTIPVASSKSMSPTSNIKELSTNSESTIPELSVTISQSVTDMELISTKSPTTSGFLVATNVKLTTVTKSPASMEELITATKPPSIMPSITTGSPVVLQASSSPLLTATETGSIGRSSTMKYYTQTLDSLTVTEAVHVSITADLGNGPESSPAMEFTKPLKPTSLKIEKSFATLSTTSLFTIESSTITTFSPTPMMIQICSHEKVTTVDGVTFEWPVTDVGSTASFKCPKNSAIKLQRKCNAGGQWEMFDQRGCGVLAKNFTNIVEASKNLTNSTLEKTADELSTLVQESLNSSVEQSMENMKDISNAFVNMANYVNTTNVMINQTVVGNIVKTLNSLLQWTPSTVLAGSSSQIVKSFEVVTSQYAQHVPVNEKINFTTSLVSITAETLAAKNLQQKGRNLAFGNRGEIIEADIVLDQLSSEQHAAINLPASLFKRFNITTNIGMFFGFYENATLFPVSTDSSALRQPHVRSHVLAATIGQNIDLRDLEDNVTLIFKLEESLTDMYVAHDSERCVSWDFNTQNWTQRGCNGTIYREKGVIVCSCNHLTNFAILVDTCPNQEACQTLSTVARLNQLNDSFTNLTNDNYGEAVAMFAEIIGGTENSTANQSSQALMRVADYFSSLATFVNDSNVIINTTVVNDVVQIVNSLLKWNPANVMVESSSSVVESFETVAALYAQQLPLNENITFTLPSLTLVAESRSVESLTVEGRSFAIGNNKATEGHVMLGQLQPEQDAVVNLPASLFQKIGNHTTIGIFFALYDRPTLFPVNRGSSNETNIGSRVLSITVGPGLHFQDLEHNITIVLRLITENLIVTGRERCVSWDFNLQDWTTQGCTTMIDQNGIVSCSCNHLTNFAVLVDICLRQEDCKPSEVDTALSYISYIGMSISIVFLVITIITLFLFKEVRQKDISKYHIQLSLAILFMLIVSFVLLALSAGDMTALYGGCITVSVLVHYFTLVSVIWMGAEALLMFQKLVYVFYKITTKFIISVSIVCWTVPIILVVIPLIVDLATGDDIASDIIVKRANTTEDITYCFLSHIGAFWGAFLGPIIIVMLFNIVIFIRVIIVMVRHTRDTAAQLNKPVSNKTILRLMISISGVMFLFGLTWLFAVLTFSVTGLRETFQILFVVFNSFQGLFIFLFVCVLNKEVLESWREVLSCGKYKSVLLHPTRTPARAVAARKYQANTNTGSTGFGSSSGGKHNTYNSESLKSGHDSSTLPTQAVQELARVPKQAADKTPTETATSDGAAAIAVANVAATNVNIRDSDRGEKTTTNVTRKNEVKIEVVEEVGDGESLTEEVSKKASKKRVVQIEVVEEV